MSTIVAQPPPSLVEGRPQLVLASTSIYRRELLARLRIPFEVSAPDIDETPRPDETPQDTADRLAREKAAVVAARYANALVIGSDQVATFDGRSIGKPGGHDAALTQLRAMRGKQVAFHTSIALHDTRDHQVRSASTLTRVVFRDLPDAMLERYLRLEQPYDCAGSAKSEGLGIALIERIEGNDPNALIGLPLIALVGMLYDAGYPLLA